MTNISPTVCVIFTVSTHMPLARHDIIPGVIFTQTGVSTHMPLARHDIPTTVLNQIVEVSTHMPLARHDAKFYEIFGE